MKEALRSFFNAIGVWFGSWKFIFHNGLAHFFLYPIIISIVLSMGAIVLIKLFVDFIMGYVNSYFQYEPLDQGLWQNLRTVFSDIGKYTTAFIIFILTFYLFNRVRKYLVLALMSPIMALLSERTDEILSGASFPFNKTQFIRDIFRGILLAVRNLFLELFLTLLMWGVAIYLSLALPFLGIILAPLIAVVSFLIGAYFFGFSTMDYHNERRRLNMRQSITYVRKNRGTALGIGTVFSLLFMLPFVGVAVGTITCIVTTMMLMNEKQSN